MEIPGWIIKLLTNDQLEGQMKVAEQCEPYTEFSLYILKQITCICYCFSTHAPNKTKQLKALI